MTKFEQSDVMALRRLIMPRLRALLRSTTIQRGLLQAVIIRRLYGMNRLAQFIHRAPSECVPIILRQFGASIGPTCDIEWGLTIHNAVTGFEHLVIEDGCHIGKEVFFDLRAPIHIQTDSTLSMRVSILTHFDAGNAWQGNDRYRSYARPVHVGAHVYVGAAAIVLPGVTLGEGCVVAAGAVVNRDAPAHTLVAGVPARIVREV